MTPSKPFNIPRRLSHRDVVPGLYQHKRTALSSAQSAYEGAAESIGSRASSRADTLKERNGELALHVGGVQGGESHDWQRYPVT